MAIAPPGVVVPPGALAPPPVALNVEFKRGRVERFAVSGPLALECCQHNGPFGIWVKCVPGEDIGTVVRLLGPKSAGDITKLKPALRMATPRDMDIGFPRKKAEEQKAVVSGNQCSMEMGLPLRIDDAEWQFDKKRLTLFYSCDVVSARARMCTCAPV